MRDIPKVALLVKTDRAFGRDLLRGIARYAHLHGPWSFCFNPYGFERTLSKTKSWSGSGIIACVETSRLAEAILVADIPKVVVEVEPRISASAADCQKLSNVSIDSVGAARLAAEHLLERGFEQFAFVGLTNREWSDRRSDAFGNAIVRAGFELCVYKPQGQTDQGSEHEQKLLAQWIEGLPKPVGLMACNDERGRRVLDACRLAGVRVPGEVAVIGVDNDELLCELADPPLSSVAINTEHGGYRIAHLLDQLMRQTIQTPQHLIIEPTQVVPRLSTDVEAINGCEVEAALNFIHRNYAQDFSVNDLVKAVGISRRNLEIKIRKSVGRTILAEIQRIRLEHAQRMLRETQLRIPEIAESSGFNSANYLTQVFRKEIGATPTNYRSRFRI